MRMLLLLLVTLHAHSMNIIPLTVVQNDASLQLNLSSPIGVPVQSKATFGKVNHKKLSSNIMNIATFVIGADNESIKWLEQHHEELKAMQALGFITNVTHFERIIALQNKFKLPLLPINVDPLLNYIHERHYPLIIAEGAVWQ